MKFCPNDACAAYGRVVYTPSTRCVFCKWDLQAPRMKSETIEGKPLPASKDAGTWGGAAEVHVPTESRPQHRRVSLRHTA